eukprot:jgi/Tetstr1/462623/TSEL_007608.t1
MRIALRSLSTESTTAESKAAALAELVACYLTHLATKKATLLHPKTHRRVRATRPTPPSDDKTLEISLSAAGKARAAAAFAKATPDKPAFTEYTERRKQREQAAAARKAAATAAAADKDDAKVTK